MNSLQTELEKIAAKINFPDKELDEDFKVDTSLPVSQQLYTYYRAHPLRTATQVAKAFPHLKPALVASTTFSLFGRGILERESGEDGFKYKAKVDTYPRYTPEARAANIKQGRKKIKKPALTAKWTETAKPEIVINHPKPVAKDVLDTMSVRQAFELYKELHVMFGRRHESND